MVWSKTTWWFSSIWFWIKDFRFNFFNCVNYSFLFIKNIYKKKHDKFIKIIIYQIELWKNHKNYENKVYVLPKKLDEKVASIHLDKIGAMLTKLSSKQSKYINVPVEGPYKSDEYRY